MIVLHLGLKKYTVHLHPIYINRITIRKDASIILHTLFKDSLIIPYCNPGDELAKCIDDSYRNHSIIFLLNHGIVFTDDDLNILTKTINTVMLCCKNHDINKHIVNITTLEQSDKSIFFNFSNQLGGYRYKCNDLIQTHQQLIDINLSTFPDFIVYLSNILIQDDVVYIINTNFNKCKDIEQILIAHILLLTNNENINYISRSDIDIIMNMQSETYRKHIL